MLQFRSVVRSHQGTVRVDNEDSGFAGASLLLVADGVGGAAAGEVASASAAYVVSAAALMEGGSIEPAEILTRAVRFANRHIYDASVHNPAWHGMSTTLTAVLTDGERVSIAHVGDSRAYRYRDGQLTQVTRDDSLLQDLLDAGLVTIEDAASYPYRNVITKSIGQQPEVDAPVSALDLRAGDRVLVCSDGISDFLEEDAILDALTLPLDDAADQLVTATLDHRGADNLTCVVADVVDTTWVRPYGTLAGAAWDPRNIINGAAVRASAHADSGAVLSYHRG